MRQITVYAFDKDDRFRFNFTVEIETEIQEDLFVADAYEEKKVKAQAKEIIASLRGNFLSTCHGANFKRIKCLRYDGSNGNKVIWL